jgi:hypothetical protein
MSRCVRSLLVLGMVVAGLLVASPSAFAGRARVFGSTFGKEGSGTGQLKEPSGIAVNEVTLANAGYVYVVDTANNRVEFFIAEGKELKGAFDGSATPAKSFAEPSAIAIDNSTNALDPSAGDVYVADFGHGVVDKFSPEGAFLGQITTGAGASPLGEIYGVAVDPQGLVWVYQASGEIDDYGNAASNAFISSREDPFGGKSPGFAVDSEDNLYVNRGALLIAKLDSTGEILVEALNPEENATTAAVNTSDDVFVDEGASIGAFDPQAALIERFGTGHLADSHGVAIDSASDLAYASNRENGTVTVFTIVLTPTALTGDASNLSVEGSATLNGTVNPERIPVTLCEFEYGTTTSYGKTTECATNPGSGSTPVPVTANLTGLAFGTYHYRLVAGNANGTEVGQDHSFLASARPAISGEAVGSVGSKIATVSAQINPGGLPSTYRVEYGTSTTYGSNTLDADAGAGTAAVGVEIQLSGLEPGTVYHARVVATNKFGETLGADMIFTTAASPGASALTPPDERAYELVSTAGQAGEAYAPDSGDTSARDIPTRRLFQAAVDGEAVAYVGAAPAVGGNGNVGEGAGNEWLAKRTTGGWKTVDITPPDTWAGTYFEAFSSDLTSWTLRWEQGEEGGSVPPLTPDAPAECRYVLYSQPGDGSYRPLFTSARSPGPFGCGEPHFAGASADKSHVLFQSEAALTAGAEEAEEGIKNHTSFEERCAFSCNLYDSINGHLSLVNVLPGPEAKTVPNATFGGQSGNDNPADLSNVISADGSRVFWTATQPGANMNHIYVRDNDASTIPVSAGAAKFWAATPDGHYAFYVEEEKLFRFNVDTKARELLAGEGLAHESAGVQGVLGVNQSGEDGAYVYLVATGVLAANENANKEKATQNEDNLYLLHDGEQTFIGILSSRDNNLIGPGPSNGEQYGDWQPDLGSRTAEVTPDGRHLLLESIRPITGYNNLNGSREVEVFVYAADTGRTVCASCSPTGAAPQIPVKGEEFSRLTPSASDTYMRRWITDDGGRVFFDSSQPLVPQDANGAQDVYEWERDGAGSCRSGGGCVYLLSGGEDRDFSYFVDADVSGSNVFFTHRGRVGGVGPADEESELYDARVRGGFPQSSLACTGTGCQGVPPAPPSFATPSSATFNGSGNFPAPPLSVVKPKPKSKAGKCMRGFVKKHGRCVKKRARKAARKSDSKKGGRKT